MTSSAKYIEETRLRAAGRKSKWNLLLIPFFLVSAGLSWYAAVRILLALRMNFFPQDAFLMNGTRLGNIFMYVSPLFPSIGVGLLFANFSLWVIPPARRTLEEEAQAHPSAGFKRSNVGLVKFVLIVSAVALPLAALGATSYFYLTPRALVYRPSIFTAERSYRWSDVTRIETACWFNRGRQENYTLLLLDGTRIGLMESSPDFLKAYPTLSTILDGRSYVFDREGVTPGCEQSLSSRWKRILMTPPSISAEAR